MTLVFSVVSLLKQILNRKLLLLHRTGQIKFDLNEKSVSVLWTDRAAS